MNEEKNFAYYLRQLASEEVTAFEVFVDLYTRMTYSYAYGILRNKEDAEDVVQEVFLKLYTMDKEQLPSRGEKSWYYKFCTNLAKDYRRKIKFAADLDEHMPFLAIDDTRINEIEAESSYFSAVSTLSEIDRIIVGLKIIAGLKHREIAEIIGKPEGTVRWRYMRAIHSLRMILSSMAVGLLSLFALLAMPPRAMAPSDYFSAESFLRIVLLILIFMSVSTIVYLTTGLIRRKYSGSKNTPTN